MNFTLRSATTTAALCNDDTVLHERVTRRQSTTFDRFLSFNENTSASAEARRRTSSKQSTLSLIELLDDEDDDRDENPSCALSHECSQCSKVFVSEYGLNHHTNMHHPNQSVLCADCNIVFRSHRSLKTHLQRHHSSIDSSQNSRSYYARTTAASTAASVAHPLPNYAYISSYLVVAFSSHQFPAIAKTACEHGRLPLGELTSKLFPCQHCHISFPCSRTLRYHCMTNHEQQIRTVCHRLLNEIVLHVELNLQTNKSLNHINHSIETVITTDEDSGMGSSDQASPLSPHDTNESISMNSNLSIELDDLGSFACQLADQAKHFGLIDKQLAVKSRRYNREQQRAIFPPCEHENRTCANLCLTHLSSYSQLLQNYPYTILTLPKGNPFAQGPIVPPFGGNGKLTTNATPSMTAAVPSMIDSGTLAESLSARQKRKYAKPISNGSSSPQLKKKMCSETHMTTRNTRTAVNNNLTVVEQSTKTTMNETKSVNHLGQSSIVTITATTTTRKILPKETPNYMRSLSFSSNSSSTSTRASSTLTKSSSSSSNLTQRTLKRSLSPSITVTLEKPIRKRRRRREQRRKTAPPSVATIKIEVDDDDIEQENDDDDDDVIPLQAKPRQPKQRQASSGSVEYVQTLSNDPQQQSSSLNNIENIKSTYSTASKISDDEIIICRSPPSTKKVVPSAKNPPKTSVNGGTRKTTMQTTSNDEHVRVRCKVCGEILEGRSRFSQHVLRMHSHLLKKNIAQAKQQQQTATIVR